jgi:hypothetical protein
MPATDFLGVDLGIANIATDSDGDAHSGRDVERIRRKHDLQRRRLQRQGTRGAKKKLRRIAGKGGPLQEAGQPPHQQGDRRQSERHRPRDGA